MTDIAPLSQHELERRQPVWQALSEFWLDTQLEHADYARIAAVLRESGYTPAELLAICQNEVAPAVSKNLASLAGEWSAFDPTWLRNRILRGRRAPSVFSRALRRFGLPAASAMFGARRHWRAVEALLRPPASGPA